MMIADGSTYNPWGNVLYSALAGLLAVGVLALLPGALLIAKSRTWAEAWFPETAPAPDVHLASLLPLGCLLLGLFFAVSGLASTVGGAAQLATATETNFSYAWRTLASGVVQFIGG